MSSYYKKINGKNYDKSMLEIAAGSVKGKGDGRISLADSKKIIKALKDGGKVTDIEKRTINYILENYKLTETALDHIEKNLSDNIELNSIKNSGIKDTAIEKADASPLLNTLPVKKQNNRFLVFLIILLLIFFALFIIIKYFYKNIKNENFISGKSEEISTSKEDTIITAKPDMTETTNIINKTEPLNDKPLSGNEYLVQDKDTLIKISESLYGDYKKWEEIYKLNKDKVSNPTLLYPGQILLIPDKNK